MRPAERKVISMETLNVRRWAGAPCLREPNSPRNWVPQVSLLRPGRPQLNQLRFPTLQIIPWKKRKLNTDPKPPTGSQNMNAIRRIARFQTLKTSPQNCAKTRKSHFSKHDFIPVSQ